MMIVNDSRLIIYLLIRVRVFFNVKFCLRFYGKYVMNRRVSTRLRFYLTLLNVLKFANLAKSANLKTFLQFNYCCG